MIDISRMAMSAGIGSAVGATIGGLKEANKVANQEDGNILGGIVGGSIVGGIGGAGISAGKQFLDAKRIARASNLNISDTLSKRTSTPSAKSNVINNTQDLNVAKQVSQATAGDTAPIKLQNTIIDDAEDFFDDDMEGELLMADMDVLDGAYDSAYKIHQFGDRRLGLYRSYDGNPITYRDRTLDEERRYLNKGVFNAKLVQREYDHGFGDSIEEKLNDVDYYLTDEYKQAYFAGLKDSIKDNLRNKGYLL